MEFTLNRKEFNSNLEIHKYIAKILEFPDYYGINLDALSDCLTDIDYIVKIKLINFSIDDPIYQTILDSAKSNKFIIIL